MLSFRRFTELPGNPYRLGRHQVHDALLPEYEAKLVSPLGSYGRSALQTVRHEEFVPPFNQGDLGSCTANAALGCLVTAPFGTGHTVYTESDAVALYELETRLDDRQIPGEYPPDDTGSTGVWSMMALEQEGRIQSYVHTRRTHTALQLLNSGPLSIGVTWFQSMFTVDSNGFIWVDESTPVAGGHQVCVVGNDVERQAVLIRNSWGTGWGEDGHGWLSWADFDAQMSYFGGDVVQPVMG